MSPAIGFLGLGTMGGPMARRLVASGYDVTGFDIDPARTKAAAEAGILPATSPAGVARAADVVLSSLTDPAAVRRAYLGEDGAVAVVRRDATLIDLSTIDPDTWREVAAAAKARGADCLDAPISGGPTDAGSGGLVFMVGGEAAVLARVRPVLETLARELHHVGPLGSGYIVKLVNNVMSMGAAVRDPQEQRRPLAPLPQADAQRPGRRLHAQLLDRAVAQGRRPGVDDGRRPRDADARGGGGQAGLRHRPRDRPGRAGHGCGHQALRGVDRREGARRLGRISRRRLPVLVYY